MASPLNPKPTHKPRIRSVNDWTENAPVRKPALTLKQPTNKKVHVLAVKPKAPMKEEPPAKQEKSKAAAPQARGVIRIQKDEERKPLSTERTRCGECAHYNGKAHPAMGAPCNTLGIQPNAVAPDCFMVNMSIFRSQSMQSVGQLAALVSSFSPAQTRSLMALMNQSAKLERKGLFFLQKVYFASGQGLVLADYYGGYVFGIDSDNNVQIVGESYLLQGRSTMTALIAKESLLTEKQFRARRTRLIESGHINNAPPRIKSVEADDWEPPSIDTAQAYLEEKAERSMKGKGKAKTKKDSSSWSIRQEEFERQADAILSGDERFDNGE